MDLTSFQLGVVLFAALLSGFSKTSVGGIVILAVPLMAMAFPGKASPGVLLPILIIADIFAVAWYRRDCDWSVLAKIFPASAVGIVAGYFLIDVIPFEVFTKVIGIVILIMLAAGILLDLYKTVLSQKKRWAWGAGFLAGVSTMMANAAGPVYSVYMLQLGLTKLKFVGTQSWYFLLVNLFKVPFSADLGLITPETLKINAITIPVVLLGAFLGVKFLKMINITVFTWLIRVVSFAAAVRLLM